MHLQSNLVFISVCLTFAFNHVHFVQAGFFYRNPSNSDPAELVDPKNSAQRTVDGMLNSIFKQSGGCQNPNIRIAPQWLRAAFHDAGTFNKQKQTGGADGSLLWEKFFGARQHAGLRAILPADRATGLSAADVIQLGGKFAVEACGGPTNLPFRTGRRDVNLFVPNADISTLPGDPFIDVAVLKARFAAMGLSPKDMLVLTTGSHTIGGATRAGSPKLPVFQGNDKDFVPFDSTPGIFDNEIWKVVLANKCLLPIDCNFAKDPTLLPLIQLYADNQTAFFQDYSASFTKMTEMAGNVQFSAFLDIKIPK